MGWDRVNPNELDTLADKLKDGEKCANDLDLVNIALNTCESDVRRTQPQFWQDPSVIISGVVFTFGLGTVFGLTRCFGLCR